ncbi:MAG: hypothetical protein U5N26_12365 [Candidatus Marinimicrobia bacterium]|nr:hypothetical protein [Candidatus Neomarinimicrobiota bacterium]
MLGFTPSDLLMVTFMGIITLGGIGLAQGINFLIFDLKFYETLAYSPDIARITGLSFLESLDFEVGLRLGIALKL